MKSPLDHHRKKSYSSPRLTAFGDVRDVTLGASMGNLESGFPNTFFANGPLPGRPGSTGWPHRR